MSTGPSGGQKEALWLWWLNKVRWRQASMAEERGLGLVGGAIKLAEFLRQEDEG